MSISNNTRTILALSSLKGIGPATIRSLRNISNISELTINEISAINKRISKALESTPNAWESATRFVEEQVDAVCKENVKILSFFDEDYPSLLKESMDDPCLIYVKGTLFKNPGQSIAVIGTREPSKQGAILTSEITNYLVDHGKSIVSGLALGCDTIAHETAIKANGHTVAVLAHGLQTIMPASNIGLANKILESGGALISQYPFGQKPSPYLFSQRDKTQAALAQGVVMIQSEENGGSIHASSASIKNNRWLAVPVRADEDPKFNANDILTKGTSLEKAELLKCKEHLVKNCITLNSELDYCKLIGNY